MRLTEDEFEKIMATRKPKAPRSTPKPRGNKFGAVKTTIDGITFDSKREGARYLDLKNMERAGQITDLRMKIKYELVVGDVKIGRYTSDFNYVENGAEVVEDVKGVLTRDFTLRRKLMLALHGVEIRVVK